MNDLAFLFGFGFILAHLLGWGFKHLPAERWQMLAVLPRKKGLENLWQGTNLTYYGFFIATSQLISLTLLIILLGAIKISILGIAPAILTVLVFAVPAARLMAMIVEKKRHTFTIGGASFVGILLAPWAIMGWDKLLVSYDCCLPTIPVLAAMSIAYTLGEGLGRLGCISYGCCYGKPVKDCNPLFRKLFNRFSFIFTGENKKVSYESQLAGERLVPIQAITCIVYTLGALVGSFLFLRGMYTEALLLTIILTQLWRILSEMWRADFRGFGKISAYQKMGLVSVIYMLGITWFIPQNITNPANITAGLQAIWSPGIILGLQLLWLVFFITFGRSTVTSATISFALLRDRI